MDKTSPKERYPFLVERSDDRATVSMQFGHVLRVRTMPIKALECVGALCRTFMERDIADIDESEVPDFPGYVQIGRGGVAGICEATLGLHKLNGTIERVIAVYDEKDMRAPVLMLVEEQIDEFIKQAE